MEEQARIADSARANVVHSAIVAQYSSTFGAEEQKQQWLPGMASGELVGAMAMTEPSTGSDLQSARTRAKLDDKSYVINGSKTFTTNGTPCDLLIIVARTSEEKGGKGLSLIIAETANLAGFEGGRRSRNLSVRG